LTQLEELGEALLDFSQPSDLENWWRGQRDGSSLTSPQGFEPMMSGCQRLGALRSLRVREVLLGEDGQA
jgi:hypothetical protein